MPDQPLVCGNLDTPEESRPEGFRAVGCGRPLEVPADRELWDVTADDAGTVMVRHVLCVCPHCGCADDCNLVSETP